MSRPEEVLLIKAVVGFITLVMASVPFGIPLLFPSFRQWVKRGIEGDNEKLDLDEFKEVIKSIVTIFGMVLFTFIIFTKYLYETSWSDTWLIYIVVMILGMQEQAILRLFKR